MIEKEIVIDANVLAHALNPDNEYYESARHLVSSLLDSELVLALDDTGKDAPLLQTSNLYREYTECLSGASVSREVINALASSGRVVFHARPPRNVWRQCRQLVPGNNNDAIVLGIGVQADRHEIITNDYADFHRSMRREARTTIGVTILDSTEFEA